MLVLLKDDIYEHADETASSRAPAKNAKKMLAKNYTRIIELPAGRKFHYAGSKIFNNSKAKIFTECCC